MGIKNEILIQKIHDLKASNSKAIVFSQFTSYLNILENDIRKEFRDIKILKLTGATRDRAKPVDDFQNSPNCSVMLASQGYLARITLQQQIMYLLWIHGGTLLWKSKQSTRLTE